LKNFTIEIRPTAEKDLERRYLQIAEESPQNAVQWYWNLMEGIRSLSVMPERCPVAPEDRAFHIGIRHLVVGSYRVLFYVEGKKVVVLHVRHSAMEREL
jgi:toxin ParE1/3/4